MGDQFYAAANLSLVLWIRGHRILLEYGGEKSLKMPQLFYVYGSVHR